MKLLYYKHKIQVWITSFLIVLIIVWVILKPKFIQFQKVKANIQEKNNRIVLLENKIKEISEKSNQLNNLRKQVTSLNKLAPSKVNEADLIAQIESLANSTGISISSISFSLPDIKGKVVSNRSTVTSNNQTSGSTLKNLKPTLLTLSVTSDLLTTEIFVNELTALDRLIDITSLVITPGETGYSTKILANIYTQDQTTNK